MSQRCGPTGVSRIRWELGRNIPGRPEPGAQRPWPPLEYREFAALELGRNIPGRPEPGAQRPWPPEHGHAEADIPQPVEAGNQPESWHPGHPVPRSPGPWDAVPPKPAPKCRPCAISGSTTRPCPKEAGRGASFARVCLPATRTGCHSPPPAGARFCPLSETVGKRGSNKPHWASKQWDTFFDPYPKVTDYPQTIPSCSNASFNNCHTPSKTPLPYGYGAFPAIPLKRVIKRLR